MALDAAIAPQIESEAVLGVEASVTGRRWVRRLADEADGEDLARALGEDEALARVLAARGVTREGASAFLNPTLRDHFPDPSRFADMDVAARVVNDAVAAGRRIAVFADYDVDGATSAAQLVRYLRLRGADALIYVPDRVTEGYGPSGQAFSALKGQGAEVVVTVDCGAMAHEALASAQSLGLEVVVFDHHQMTAAPPPAAAVVNPNRPDCQSGCGHLAAAGVTFIALAALNRDARDRGLFTGPEPNLLDLLDLAALGTFCDVVSLTGVNRAIAAQGLKVMGRWANPGLKALAEVSRAEGPPTAYTAGFLLGPRINAGGRVGCADLGARLLSTDDPAEAATIAEELNRLNADRRALEQATFEEAVAQVETDPRVGEAAVIVASGEGWHPGVIGIVAGRLKERFGRPAVAVALPRDAEEPGKGSGRSVPGVDLGQAIADAREAGVLIAGGGHAMAAGLTVARERLEDLRAALIGAVEAQGPLPGPTLKIDAALSPSGATRAFAEIIAKAGPFGAGNPQPTFVFPRVTVTEAGTVGTGHVRVAVEDASGRRLRAIAFRADDTALGAALREAGRPLHMAARVSPGRGTYVDVQIEDAALAD